jgi:hypothetical protein
MNLTSAACATTAKLVVINAKPDHSEQEAT